MKIFIEGRPIFAERSGVGQYTKRLVETMAKLYSQHSYTFFGFKLWPQPLPESPFPKKLPIKYRFIRFLPARGYNYLFKLGIAPPVDLLLGRRPDIIVYPNFVRWPVLNRKIKTMLIVYDLSFIDYPHFTHPKNLPYLQKHVPASIKRADHIVTISKNSKQEIIDYYQVDPAKINIINPAVDHKEYYPRSKKEIDKIRLKYKLPDRYILYVGTLEPRKNVEGILLSYAALETKIKQQYPLVLVGGKGWLDESIRETMKQLRSKGENIIETGYTPDEDQPAIYSGASLFVYPSFYEGFGMPPLEAMACGVPVISADNTSLPEVGGDAVMYVKAEDTSELTKEIAKVLNDKSLTESLREKGIKQAHKFTWEKSAEKLLQVLKNTAEKSG